MITTLLDVSAYKCIYLLTPSCYSISSIRHFFSNSMNVKRNTYIGDIETDF